MRIAERDDKMKVVSGNLEPARGSADSDKSAFVVAYTLIVADIDRSVAFYRDVLGATVLAEVPVYPTHAVAPSGFFRRVIDTVRLWFS